MTIHDIPAGDLMSEEMVCNRYQLTSEELWDLIVPYGFPPPCLRDGTPYWRQGVLDAYDLAKRSGKRLAPLHKVNP